MCPSCQGLWDRASEMTLDTLATTLTSAEEEMEALPLPRYRQDSYEFLRIWIMILSAQLAYCNQSLGEEEGEEEEEDQTCVCEVCSDSHGLVSQGNLCYDCHQDWCEYQVRHYSQK